MATVVGRSEEGRLPPTQPPSRNKSTSRLPRGSWKGRIRPMSARAKTVISLHTDTNKDGLSASSTNQATLSSPSHTLMTAKRDNYTQTKLITKHQYQSRTAAAATAPHSATTDSTAGTLRGSSGGSRGTGRGKQPTSVAGSGANVPRSLSRPSSASLVEHSSRSSFRAMSMLPAPLQGRGGGGGGGFARGNTTGSNGGNKTKLNIRPFSAGAVCLRREPDTITAYRTRNLLDSHIQRLRLKHDEGIILKTKLRERKEQLEAISHEKERRKKEERKEAKRLLEVQEREAKEREEEAIRLRDNSASGIRNEETKVASDTLVPTSDSNQASTHLNESQDGHTNGHSNEHSNEDSNEDSNVLVHNPDHPEPLDIVNIVVSEEDVRMIQAATDMEKGLDELREKFKGINLPPSHVAIQNWRESEQLSLCPQHTFPAPPVHMMDEIDRKLSEEQSTGSMDSVMEWLDEQWMARRTKDMEEQQFAMKVCGR